MVSGNALSRGRTSGTDVSHHGRSNAHIARRHLWLASRLTTTSSNVEPFLTAGTAKQRKMALPAGTLKWQPIVGVEASKLWFGMKVKCRNLSTASPHLAQSGTGEEEPPLS